MAEDQGAPSSEPVLEAQVEAAPPAIENVAGPTEPITQPTEDQPVTEVEPPPPEPEIATSPAVSPPPVQEIIPPPAANPPPPPVAPNLVAILIVDAAARARAYASVVKRREERLAKIVALARQKGSVTNLIIVRFLHVSEATANRYLRALVSEGRLKAEGGGRGRRYAIVP